MLSAQSTKFCVMAALFVATFTLSMLPIKLMKMAQRSSGHRSQYKSALSILSCYAAGVFLATCLLDLFPAVEDTMGKALDRAGIYTSYPVPEFLLAFGLFLILVVEQLVLVAQEQKENHREERKPLLSDDKRTVSSSGSQHQGAINGGSGSYNADLASSYNADVASVQVAATDEDHESAEDIIPSQEEAYQDPASHSVLRSVMLLLALSLHSIFEGLAVGLQPSTDTVLQIFAALILHKCILAFSLGLNLVQSRMKVSAIIRGNLIFSVTSPLGIGIGIAIDHFSPYSLSSNLIQGILQGLACGTFIYVVFFEILPHEFNSSTKYPNRLLKVLFLMLGFSTVSLILLFLPDEVDTKHVGN